MNADSPGMAYRLFSLLLLPFWLIHGFLHGRNYGLPGYLSQRFWSKKNQSTSAQVWIHASSVGEVVAVSPLVNTLIKQGESILFTSFTASGYQTIKGNFPNGINAGVIPVDFIINCRLFIRQNKIKLCLLMETELWPELLYQTAQRNIPIIQINARLSNKTTDAPIFIRYMLRRAISAIRLHLARNQQDKALLLGLGADEANIKVIGNLKSRFQQTELPTRLIDQDYLLLASSHEGEEQLLLEQMPAQWQKQLIVIAPRHPKRSESIQKELSNAGIQFAVRSLSQPVKAQTQVYLADTLGELKAFMAHASLVIMGGSFDQTGGHNLIEPASLGCAIITGPSDSNIINDIQLLGDAIIQVKDMAACWKQVGILLADPTQATVLGQKALEVIKGESDVLENYLTEIKPYL